MRQRRGMDVSNIRGGVACAIAQLKNQSKSGTHPQDIGGPLLTVLVIIT